MAQMSLRSTVVLVLVLSVLGCDFDVSITAKPTRRIDPRLLGAWTSSDGKDRMTIRKYDDSNYVISSADGALFRAYHSDISGNPLITVQDITSADRKYFYVRWRVNDRDVLSLEGVNDAVIPKTTRTSTAVVKLIRTNATNPKLFVTLQKYTRDRPMARR